MKKFTIITKDGSKWLRPESATIGGPNLIYTIPNGEDLPYIGTKPEGTTLDESEVTAITQARHKDYTGSDWFNVYDNGNWDYYQTRTVYTDAESHGRHISEDSRYPLFQHLSEEYGLTLLDSELDEIARHAAPMTGVEYWKRRCKVAESMIGMCPSDPKTYDEFCRLYDEWEQIIEEGRAYGN